MLSKFIEKLREITDSVESLSLQIDESNDHPDDVLFERIDELNDAMIDLNRAVEDADRRAKIEMVM